jgi:hypothetical protein
MRPLAVLLASLALLAAQAQAQSAPDSASAPPVPRHYDAHRVEGPTPVEVDGLLDEEAWRTAPWTDAFVDIRGGDFPEPHHRTRAKLLWDDTYLYVAARLEEPDLWATLSLRDAIIYRDHDFEIFLDPNSDGLAYYEFEINAFGTEFDLFLDRPYRDGGRAFIDWDMPGLLSAVHLEGTLNDPNDQDQAWTVEVAIPWEDLVPPQDWEGWNVSGAARPIRDRLVPSVGDSWRVNFSRVHWPLVVTDGAYVKEVEPTPEDPHPEWNWVWSPQGEINMHIPEMWGFVTFVGVAGGGR